MIPNPIWWALFGAQNQERPHITYAMAATAAVLHGEDVAALYCRAAETGNWRSRRLP